MTDGRSILILDAAYSLETIRARGIEHSITSRDLDGFFDQVWSVHPLVGADPDLDRRPIGPIRVTRIDRRHTFVEGMVGRFAFLRRVPVVNFILGQTLLVVALARIVRRHDVTMIRAGDPYYLGLMGLLLARIARIPLVIRVSGNYDAIYSAVGRLAYPKVFRSRRIEKKIDRFVLKRADLVVAPNEDNLEFALANGARRSSTAVFAYGNLIDPAHFEDPDERASVAEDLDLNGRPYLVCVSRLEPVKHPDDVIRAFEVVHRAHPEVALVLVGDGSMRAQLEEMSAQLGVDDRVRFAGNRDQQWIARCLAHAAVVVAAMAGRALVEAALSGTPIVAYDVDWHAELIEHDRTGLLVPYRDTDALARAVDKLLQDEPLRRDLSLDARKQAMEKMDPQMLTQKERECYERLLSRNLESVR